MMPSVPVAQYFDRNVARVHATLGWEQEYFLVDAALYGARPDLVLHWKKLCLDIVLRRGQQLDDHYFGSIPDRAVAFMRDFEEESLRLGIPIKTRHNEVAPNQFECAPLFEEANLAVDHNLPCYGCYGEGSASTSFSSASARKTIRWYITAVEKHNKLVVSY